MIPALGALDFELFESQGPLTSLACPLLSFALASALGKVFYNLLAS